jgi:tripartite-type tricarboxylate transporter receptor subunit TctC
VTGKTRSGLMPDVPTIAESGLTGFEASLYYGLVAPAGTPRPVLDRLNRELRVALASDEVKKQLAEDGTESRRVRRTTMPISSTRMRRSGRN